MLKELAEGTARGGKASLKPIDVLTRVQALLELDEPLSSLKKVRRPPRALPGTPELVDGVRRLHRAYDFDPEVYQFVGVASATLREAGVLSRGPGLVASEARKRAPKRGAA